MQVEGCVNLGGECWAAACSSLTGAHWGGGLSVFSSAGTGPFIGKYQWSSTESGITSISNLGHGLVVGGMNGAVLFPGVIFHL